MATVHGGIMLIQAVADETEHMHFFGDIPAVLLMGILLWCLVPKRVPKRAREA